MHTVEITLEQVLLARDRRVQRQQALHRQYGGTLLSFTMNIAGPVKDTPLVRLAFRAGLAALDRDLGAPVHRESVAAPTGPEALLVYHRPAGAVKDLCLRLEEQALQVWSKFEQYTLPWQGITYAKETKDYICLLYTSPSPRD